MIRIVAGKYRGLRLEQPSFDIVRPTMDRIKEATFSSIQFDVVDSNFLDLYSGSGSIAFEAISRGATSVVAVDNSFEAIACIKDNKEKLKVENIAIIKTSALSYIESVSNKTFDIIYMDPPYENIDLYNQTITAIHQKKILDKNGTLIIETDNPDSLKFPEEFVIKKKKNYGKVFILYISNNI